LLEGLEAVEMNFSECQNIIDFRIDANTYKKNYINTAKLITKTKHSNIDELSISVQNFGAYSLCNFINFVEDGIPFLMTENIRHNYIDWNVQKFVDNESHEMLWKSHCKKNQVLVTMAGEYLGRVAVYDKDFVCSSNQAIAKVTLKKGLYPYYISTFLNCKHGQNQINRLKTITGQPNINMSLIKVLDIILLSEFFQKRVSEVVIQAHSISEQSNTQYTVAENILLQELGLVNWLPVIKNNNTKTLKESFLSSGRIDAEYYQPKYDELLQVLKQFKHDTLDNLVTIQKSIEPGSDAYQNEGIPFIRVANLSKNGISESNVFLSKDEFGNFHLMPKKNTILLSKDGSVGIAYKVEEDIQAVTSGAILHLTISNNKVLPDYLTLVLNSIVVKLQAERDAGGSIIQHWKPDEIKQVIIPVIDDKIQKTIADKIQQSFALLSKSHQLFEAAKKAVEIAIEQNENTALDYLNKN
jgi:restriction endonuclease S subunit